VVVRPPAGAALRVPFAIAFGPPRQELLPEAELSQETFSPADAVPTVLTLRAGFVERVGGLDQIEPVERLDIELFTGDGKRIGVVARVRNLLPGRFAFGITGRDPGGQRLKPGPYSLRLVAVPAGGGPASTRLLPFTIR
nr:hypothetical protein [Actinomycetota bacterium]